MPELPEIEVLKRSLAGRLEGRRIARVEVRKRSLREPVQVSLAKRVEGRMVLGLRRRAKYLLIDLEGEITLVVHLGMSGRLKLSRKNAPLEAHSHVTFHLRPAGQLRFADPRRFGLVLALPTAGLEADRHFAHLGVEPLDDGFSGAGLRALARGRRGPVKNFLMDQRVVVGVGNIYATEALFRAGIRPGRSVGRIARAAWEALAGAVREVLREAIGQGGTTLNDFADSAGKAGYFQVALRVYGRAGEPCLVCRVPVRRIVQAGRSSFYCPQCQG